METPKILITRNDNDGTDKETLGKMHVVGTEGRTFDCVTLELPDKNNQRQISCYPKGHYKGIKVGATVNIPYPHIWIKNVPGRDGIKIHRANYYRQLRGCTAVGKTFVDLDGDLEPDVTDSKNTLDAIMAILPDGVEFDIIVQ